MTLFDRLRARFAVSWTTILVGWIGASKFQPTVSDWHDYTEWLSADEVHAFASGRLTTETGAQEMDLIVSLPTDGRDAIRDHLERLAGLERGDEGLELRKWRVALLEEVLSSLSPDPIYALVALTGFWQTVGFPADMPHVVQGRDNSITPENYYTEATLSALLVKHRSWLTSEVDSINERSTLGPPTTKAD